MRQQIDIITYNSTCNLVTILRGYEKTKHFTPSPASLKRLITAVNVAADRGQRTIFAAEKGFVSYKAASGNDESFDMLSDDEYHELQELRRIQD